MMPLRARSDKQ